MGILSSLFGSSKPAESAAKPLEYNGFEITPEPFKAGGGWQLAGRISKGGKTHKFIRADQFSSRDEAVEFTLVKGKLIVDQMGEAMFSA